MTLAEFETACRDLARALSWEWDDRFEMALAVHAADDAQVTALLDRIFDGTYTTETLDAATAATRQTVARIGLRAGQTLRTRGGEDLLLYAAAWPWSDGRRVSVRVGWHAPPGSAARARLEREFSGWIRG